MEPIDFNSFTYIFVLTFNVSFLIFLQNKESPGVFIRVQLRDVCVGILGMFMFDVILKRELESGELFKLITY